MRIVNTILLVLILIVASGSAYFYFFIDRPAQGPAQPLIASKAPVSAPIFLALEPFTVTIKGERGTRIFYTEITLRLNTIDAHTNLIQYMPDVRNRVLAELSQHHATDLQTSTGRGHLAERIKKVLSASYHPQLENPNIASVLFTAFVIQ